MKPIYDAYLVQIEVTNMCNIGCANCTRMVGHHKKPYFMDLDLLDKAFDSLEGFKGGIGIIGGEPTLHPQFREMCKLIQKKGLAPKCGLWTSGYKWSVYKEIIKDTFKLGVLYNDHSDPKQRHQPTLVSIDEVVEDKELMWKLIDNCWVQQSWSPSINPKGAFFCEVAAALDLTFNGPGGYPLERDWWNKNVQQMRDQVERYCPMCGEALPLERPSSKQKCDLITPKNCERLVKLGSPKCLRNKIEIFDRKLSFEEVKRLQQDWRPWDYLSGSIRKKDLKLDEVFMLGYDRRDFIHIAIKHPDQTITLMSKAPKETISNLLGINHGATAWDLNAKTPVTSKRL
jgi:hypothetical protein